MQEVTLTPQQVSDQRATRVEEDRRDQSLMSDCVRTVESSGTN